MKHTRIYRAVLLALTASVTIACSSEITDTEAGNRTETGEAGKLITVIASQPTATESTGAPQTRMTYNEPNLQGNVVVNWAKEDQFYLVAELPQADKYTALNEAFTTFTLNGGAGSPYGTFTGEVPKGTIEKSTLYAIGGKKEKLTFINSSTKKGIGFSYEYQAQTGNDNKDHLSNYDFIVATATYSEGTTPKFDFNHIGAMMKFTITLPKENMELSQLSLVASGSVYPFSSKMIWKTNEPQTLESDDTTNEVTLDLKQDYGNLQIDGNVLTAYMMVAPSTEVADKPVVLKIVDEDDDLYTAILNGATIEAGKYYTVNAKVVTFNGEGSENSPYEINDAGELRKMAKLVNAGLLEDECFKLTKDIDLGSESWTPIDGFGGTFSGEKEDGGSYTISNMKINGTLSAVNLGLFADLYSGKISHVTVSGEINATVNMMYFNSFTEIGGIVGRSNGSIIEYCSSQCTINVTAGDGIKRICAGGIVGYSNGTLTNCTNSGNISLTKGAMTTELYTGAIVGQIYKDATVILNGYTNTGSPSSIIGFYEFSSGSTGSLTISETVGGTTTTINSGSGPYPIPDKGITLGDRNNVTW